MCSSWICLQNSVQWGTLRYMSPEILEGSVHLHNKWYLMHADVYSLALLLWEIWMCCSDFSHGTLSRYVQVLGCCAAGRTFPSVFRFLLLFYRRCCSTASLAIWIWAGSQCLHREPHFARVSHGHETLHTATLGSAVTGSPKYNIGAVTVLLLNSFVTRRGLPWRRSWQILGTLNQMLVCLLSALQTDWSLFSLTIMYLLSICMLLFVCQLCSCIQMSLDPLLHLVYYRKMSIIGTSWRIFYVLEV